MVVGLWPLAARDGDEGACELNLVCCRWGRGNEAVREVVMGEDRCRHDRVREGIRVMQDECAMMLARVIVRLGGRGRLSGNQSRLETSVSHVSLVFGRSEEVFMYRRAGLYRRRSEMQDGEPGCGK